MISIKALLAEIHPIFELNWNSDVHGLPHWSRVYTNARLITQSELGRDSTVRIHADVLTLFSFLHDHKRINDGGDPGHGLRAAMSASLMQGRVFNLSNDELDLLFYALEYHSDGLTVAPLTVQVCWDSDRLDLGRVGKYPNPEFLCTETAKDPHFIEKAFQRSIKRFTS